MTIRSKVAMLVAEFLGTGILATAVINVFRSQIGIGYFVAFSVAITLATLVLVLGPTSGGHFNPAVTLGMWTLRKIQTIQALAFIAVQMLGGFAALRLAEYFTSQKLTNIAGNSFEWKILIAEAVGTAIFTFGIAAAVYQRFEGGRLATAIGASLFVGTIVASIASNAALNPAIALANNTWSWAYAVGPLAGAIVGMNLYALLFAPARALAASASSTTTTVSASSKRSAASARKKPAAKSSRGTAGRRSR